MKLTTELIELSNNFSKDAPVDVQKKMQMAHDELVNKSILENSLDEGDRFPHFELLNQNHHRVKSSSLLKDKDFLVISFYRGGWCPYCNLELKSLQNHLIKLNELGADLVAISPELSDSSLTTSEKNDLKFQVLSDSESKLSAKLGISFSLPETLKPIYKKFGIDIESHNGNYNFTLPVPATYLVDSEFNIIYCYKNIDYKKRLDPEKIIEIIKRRHQMMP